VMAWYPLSCPDTYLHNLPNTDSNFHGTTANYSCWHMISAVVYSLPFASVPLGSRLLAYVKCGFLPLSFFANKEFQQINLRHGLLRTESIETCSAGAGSLLLEFATLSRLTDDPIFEVSKSTQCSPIECG
jgi:hypothetical protein